MAAVGFPEEKNHKIGLDFIDLMKFAYVRITFQGSVVLSGNKMFAGNKKQFYIGSRLVQLKWFQDSHPFAQLGKKFFVVPPGFRQVVFFGQMHLYGIHTHNIAFAIFVEKAHQKVSEQGRVAPGSINQGINFLVQGIGYSYNFV